jgi:hypothetical protein
MNNIIEDGYNTAYISVLFFVLFYEQSMIERCVLLENFSENNKIMYLQKMIQMNFVKPLRNNIIIPSYILNEIRLCFFILEWKPIKSICEIYAEYEPIDILFFLCKSINKYPIEYVYNDNIIKDVYIEFHEVEKNIQLTYNKWNENNMMLTSNSLPPFIIFKILNLQKIIEINKKIKLFPTSPSYKSINWIFHGLFYKNKDSYSAIVSKNDNLFSYKTKGCSYIEKIQKNVLTDMCNKDIYIVYRKEPII